MAPKRKARVKQGNGYASKRKASADADQGPLSSAAIGIQLLPVATAAAEPIDAGAGAHHSGSSRYPWQAPH